MQNRRLFLAQAGIAGLATALPAAALPPAPRRRAAAPGDTAAAATLSSIAEEILADFPESATQLGIDTGPRAALKARLTDHAKAADTARAARVDVRRTALGAIDRTRLSPQVALDVEVTQAAYDLAHDGYAAMPYGDVAILNPNNSYRSTPYVVSQGTGAFAEVPDMLESKHAVATRADAEAYLSRLEGYAAALDAETARIAADAAAGVILPRFLIDITAAQLDGAARQPVADWNLVTTFAAKTARAGVPGAWAASATQIATAHVAPALARQAAAFAALRDKAGDTPGMWKLPDADRAYAWLCRAGTTTARTPAEIHASGLEQVAALSAELDVLLKAQGLTGGSVGARLAALGKRPDMLYANTDAGRAELLAHLNRVVADIRPRMARAFHKLVPGRLDIRRVPPSIENGAPNGYAAAGSIDGKVPGTYYINLRDTGIWPRFALPTLTYHEGIPGHVWQGEYSYDLPLIRTLLAFNAYSEGWALYAEQLADEVGAYDGDPIGRIGYLQSMNFRASRLVADTGLHHERWSMDKAMRWFGEATGLTASQCRSELNRYCAWPGQALGYKTGHNEINRLRAAARTALGPRFDQREFNTKIITTPSPLGVLGMVVDAWVADRKPY